MKKLAIYTCDTSYSQRLTDYLAPRIDHEFFIQSFSEEEAFIKAYDDELFSALIITENQFRSLVDGKEKKLDKIICLTEEKNHEDSEGIVFAYKYQPASKLINKVISQEKSLLKKESQNNNKTRLIGIFSPNGGVGKTTLSIAIAKVMAKSHRVLFLSLEPFNCICEMLYLDERKSLSELLYKCAIMEKIDKEIFDEFIQNEEGYDVIAPINSLIELQSVDEHTWNIFLEYLCDYGLYDDVIIDLSEAVNNLHRIIDRMDKLIIPCGEGMIRHKKIQNFKNELIKDMSEELHFLKTKYIEVPYFVNQEDVYEGTEKSKMGRWIENIINEI